MNKITIILRLVSELLLSLGMMGIFRKCHCKGYWAFIPFARKFHLGLVSEKEAEGRVLTVIEVCRICLDISLFAVPRESRLYMPVLVAYIVVLMVDLIYLVRVYFGLCEVFQREKRWVTCFILLEPVTALVWGFSQRFQPVRVLTPEGGHAPAPVSRRTAETLERGLTVNLIHRRAIRYFRIRTILADIHFSIPPGRMVLLLGGSGAGKTIFMNAVTGYEKANAKITLNKSDIYRNYKSLKYDIGFVPQQDLMRDNDTTYLTLLDAASLRLPSTVTQEEKRKRVDEVLRILGLSAAKNTIVKKLSGGQKRRLSIAMEFISDPTLFVLDEPDSGLDGTVARSLFERLRAIADNDKIVMCITHTPDRVADLFDDVIVLCKDSARVGRVAYFGTLDGAREFFDARTMEGIVRRINPKEVGGEGRADEFISKYAEKGGLTA